MGIKCTTPESEIDAYYDRCLQSKRQKMIDAFKYVGEKAVEEARNNHRYENQTENLESSIGYCVLEDGKVIFGGDFVGNGQQGTEKGRKYLESLLSKYSKGIALIVVAGMEYAAYVEAKNLNVLDSAELMAEKLLPEILKGSK